METPPELVVLCETLSATAPVNVRVPLCFGLSYKGRDTSLLGLAGVNSPDPLLCLLPLIEARTDTQWFLYLHFVQRLTNLRICNSGLETGQVETCFVKLSTD